MLSPKQGCNVVCTNDSDGLYVMMHLVQNGTCSDNETIAYDFKQWQTKSCGCSYVVSKVMHIVNKRLYSTAMGIFRFVFIWKKIHNFCDLCESC